MPTYRYHCPSNDQTLEIRHGMRERVETWGELCQRLLRPLGTTSPEAPVKRLLDGGILLTSRATEPECCTDPSCGHGR